MAVNGRNDRDQEDEKVEEGKKTTVYMWGYLPGVSPEKSPILTPIPVKSPDTGDLWKDVCGGGCGFAMAISGGKLLTWGSVDEENQSYITCGKHGDTPEAFLLPSEASIIKAAAGWAHCVSVTETGEVYTWGWKECVPLGKFPRDGATWGAFQKDNATKQNVLLSEQGSQGTNSAGGAMSHSDNKKDGEEIVKRRRVSVVKEESENSQSGDEYFTVIPSIVSLGPGVRITSVAAGGRHTLALSGYKKYEVDMGQVWGWGYGGEGQLGLGSRIKMVSSPHLIPCTEQPACGKDRSSVVRQGTTNLSVQVSKLPGSYVKEIACGGRHSAVVTDAGELLTFGWGLYGQITPSKTYVLDEIVVFQCGQGSTNDQLRPTSLPSLSGIQVERIAAGLWHTLCVTIDGHVYAFGGNQFGQLGTGAEQGETLPRLLDAPCLESKQAKMVSCGARHSAVLTEDGQVFSWGWNKYGQVLLFSPFPDRNCCAKCTSLADILVICVIGYVQLGVGDSIDRNIPSQVPIEGCRPKNVACGWWHTLLLAETPLKS
ncbi:unnamed protein product [Dovyalis caffra]|uniref:RCC1-like domain-containing protein n=1 Tax=Dovyalis caffra TaxID=77055 RepID=A0AAV1S231_9ROSI|nr:unnamed protein product [Dovyalis caffra]